MKHVLPKGSKSASVAASRIISLSVELNSYMTYVSCATLGLAHRTNLFFVNLIYCLICVYTSYSYFKKNTQ